MTELTFPTQEEILAALRIVRRALDVHSVAEVDVRLCVDRGSWCLRSGDVCYDEYHSELCAAEIVTQDMADVDLILLSKQLLDDVLDESAMREI